jgi:outer membrane protein
MKIYPRAASRLAAVLTLASLAFAGAASAPSTAAADSKIAVVDIQRAMLATEDGIRAQATMRKRFDKRQQDLDAKKTELQRAQDDIEKQSRVLSREALQKRGVDWQQQMVKLQTVYVEYQQELQKMQGELIGPIDRKMRAVISRLALKNGYDLVIDRPAALYARPDLELTDQVVQMYNSGGDDPGAQEKKPGGSK